MKMNGIASMKIAIVLLLVVLWIVSVALLKILFPSVEWVPLLVFMVPWTVAAACCSAILYVALWKKCEEKDDAAPSDRTRNMEIPELQRTVQILRATIRQLEQKIEKDKRIEQAMTHYFDALYDELIRITGENDREFEKDRRIDRIMETVYDNIHLAFDSIVKDKSRELDEAKDALDNYNDYVKELIHNRTQELSEENRRLQEIAMTDELTGLTNRRGFFTLAQAKYNDAMIRKCPVSLIFIDLDGFKSINDTYGHDEGDRLLKNTSWILHRSFRGDDIICRYGGDEFAVFIETGDVSVVMQRIDSFVKEFNARGEKKYELNLSVGCETLVPEKDLQIEDLLSTADKKMYEIKMKKKRVHTT